MTKKAPITGRERCLKHAHMAVMATRNKTYGNPLDNFTDTAKFFNTFLQAKMRKEGIENTEYIELIQPNDIALLMVMLKTARLINQPAHGDSYIDIAGYAACGYECANPSNI